MRHGSISYIGTLIMAVMLSSACTSLEQRKNIMDFSAMNYHNIVSVSPQSYISCLNGDGSMDAC